MKKRRIFFIVLLSCGLVWLSSCRRSDVPDNILPESKMVDLMTDVYLLEGYYADETMYHFDSMPNEIAQSYEELYAKYGITQAEYDTNMTYYMRDPKKFESIQQQVLDRLEKGMTDL